MELISNISKKIYKSFPENFRKSTLIFYLKIFYWRYLQNLKRFKILKKINFELSEDQKIKYKKIKKNISDEGIIIEKPHNVFNDSERNTLKKIVELSNEKILNFENKKNNDDFQNFFKNLKSRGVYKPFRYDLGGYLNFKEKKLYSNDFDELNYEILKIGLKEEFLYLASLYLGIYPFLGRFYAWYDFPTKEQAVSSQCWHKDGDDRKFLKIFIYLNNVSNENGPFCFIKKTHLMKNKKKINFTGKKTKFSTFDILEDRDVKNIYEDNQVTECFGEFGTTIFADTSGFHKGKKLINKKRIMLVFEYFSQVSDYSYKIDINEIMKNRFNEKQLLALKKI